MLKNKTKWILIAAIVLYAAVFSFITLKKYYNFGYNAFDLALFNQVFFNTLHGQWFFGTININNYLADHFSPIIFGLLPFYNLRQTPESLLILQSLISALCAWPFYLIAKKITKNNKLALACGLLWLANPFVHNANFYEWHILTVAAFLIFWTFYFYLKNNFKIYILFFILSLFCREDIALVMLGFGVLSILDKKSLHWKLFSLAVPIIYFLVALKIIHYYSLTGEYKFFVYYGWLGGETLLDILFNWLKHPLAVFLHMFSLQNLFGLLVILMPFLFLPIFKPKYWVLSILPICQFLLTTNGFTFIIYRGYYAMIFLPGIFISLIFVLNKIQNKAKHNNIFLLLTITVLYFLIFLSPLKAGLFTNYDISLSQARQQFVADIPPQASLAVETTLQPALSSRQIIYDVGNSYYASGQFASYSFELPLVDYIVMDYSNFISTLIDAQHSNFWRPTRDAMPAHWRSILEDYTLIRASNSHYLWQNKQAISESGLRLYETSTKQADFDSTDFLVASSFDNHILKLTFQKKNSERQNYLVRFYKNGEYFDIPLDYGIYPEREWAEDTLYSFYYYPDTTVDSFRIFSWLGQNRLGAIKNAIIDLKLVPLGDQISL